MNDVMEIRKIKIVDSEKLITKRELTEQEYQELETLFQRLVRAHGMWEYGVEVDVSDSVKRIQPPEIPCVEIERGSLNGYPLGDYLIKKIYMNDHGDILIKAYQMVSDDMKENLWEENAWYFKVMNPKADLLLASTYYCFSDIIPTERTEL